METKNVKIAVADPTPLGLFGLAMVTLIASSQKLGITDGLAFILPGAMFLGGVAQIIAGMMDFKHNNIFGATAFNAYGLFWICMAMCWLTKMGCLGETLAADVDGKQMGFAFVGYMILSAVLTVSTVKMSKAMFLLMSLIVILFLTLALDAFGCGHLWHTIAACSELGISLVSFYVLAAKYLNTFFGREMVKTGKAFCVK